jgi:hypothetical protein
MLSWSRNWCQVQLKVKILTLQFCSVGVKLGANAVRSFTSRHSTNIAKRKKTMWKVGASLILFWARGKDEIQWGALAAIFV